MVSATDIPKGKPTALFVTELRVQNTQEVKNERFLKYRLDKIICEFSANVAFDKATNRYETRNVENTYLNVTFEDRR